MVEVYDLYDEYIYLNGHWEQIGGGGSNITVDNHLSTTSENPVQNKVITQALNTFAVIDDSQSSSNTTYSSDKIISLITNVVGDIASALDEINGEVI